MKSTVMLQTYQQIKREELLHLKKLVIMTAEIGEQPLYCCNSIMLKFFYKAEPHAISWNLIGRAVAV